MSNLFLFHGPDNFSSQQKIRFWREQFTKKHGDMNIEILDNKKIAPAEIRSAINSHPFLGEKRLVIVKDFFQNASADQQKVVADFIDKVPEFCILAFLENQSADKRTSLYKKLQKLGTVEEFASPDPAKILTFLRQESQKLKLNISISTLTYLSQILPPNLWTASNELQKLANYSETQEITREVVDNLVTPSLSSSIFNLTDQICTRKHREAFSTLKTLYQSGEEITKIFFMVVRHFRILIQISELANKGFKESDIVRQLKQHPFTVKKAIGQTRSLSPQTLKTTYQKLLEIDTRVKTGKIRFTQQEPAEFVLALEQLILTIN